MGKALLFIIAAIGASSVQTLVQANGVQGRAAVQQAIYENDVIATQIARAGYNVAYAMIYEAASPLEGVAAVNNAANGLRGTYLGGEYRVTANMVGGTTIAIQSRGYYGGTWQGERYVGKYVAGRYFAPSVHFIGDDRQEIPFNPDPADARPRRLTGQFIMSNAGYCSAVFVQRYLQNTTPANQPAPEMMFEPGNTRNGAASSFDLEVMPGTQLNFFIGVDQNCSMRPSGAQTWNAIARENYVDAFNNAGRNNRSNVTNYLDDFDYIHKALDVDVEDLANLRESPWAMIERRQGTNETWRIGWEDIHNTSWLTGTTPATSLRLTKERGYNGAGWQDRLVSGYLPSTLEYRRNQPDGYRDLYDHGSMPDFEDQVIEVSFAPINNAQTATIVQPVRPTVAAPALPAGNGGCPTGKTAMNRPSVRRPGVVNRICVEPARVAAFRSLGATTV
ncbi:MAG TPA: hypothetical protein VF594_08770 [Rubricoccaceae bacterium]|jgi:hypothetical protein